MYAIPKTIHQPAVFFVLLMEEILHHLGYKKHPANNGISYPSTGARFPPSTVAPGFYRTSIGPIGSLEKEEKTTSGWWLPSPGQSSDMPKGTNQALST